MERDELLECAALVEIRVVEAPDHDVGDVEVPSARRRCRRAVGEMYASGSSPSTWLSARQRVPFPPSTTAPCSEERTSSQPTCGCSRSAGRRRGWCSSISSKREPGQLLHQVDEPEIPQAEHDDMLARRRRSWPASGSLPVASFSACPTIAFCSSPPANSATSPPCSDRETRSSRP